LKEGWQTLGNAIFDLWKKLFHVVVDHHKKVEIMIAFITTIKDRGESRSRTYCIGGTKVAFFSFYDEIRNN